MVNILTREMRSSTMVDMERMRSPRWHGHPTAALLSRREQIRHFRFRMEPMGHPYLHSLRATRANNTSIEFWRSPGRRMETRSPLVTPMEMSMYGTQMAEELSFATEDIRRQ